MDFNESSRTEARIVRVALVCLFVVTLLGLLLGIVFIYLNINDRLTRLENEVFASEGPSESPLTGDAAENVNSMGAMLDNIVKRNNNDGLSPKKRLIV